MTTTLPRIPVTAGPFIFIVVAGKAGLWRTFDGRFELSRQDYEGDDGSGDPALVDDWGVWDTVADDWAHEETGYPTMHMALDAFKRSQGLAV